MVRLEKMLIAKNEKVEIHKVSEEDFQKLSGKYDNLDKKKVFSVYLKDTEEIIGMISIRNDQSRNLMFDFENEDMIVESCNVLIDHLKENGYEYITYSTNEMNPEIKEILRGLNMRYKYSYSTEEEDYRMYQTSVTFNNPYTGYWDMYPHYIESSELR